MDLEQLGALIHYKREEAGIPLSTVAKRAGIGRSTLWIIERGANPQTGNPSRPAKETIERLAEALHLNQAETEELLSLADYTVAGPSTDTRANLLPATSPTITEINGTVYYAHDGCLEAFDARTGDRLWSTPSGVSFPVPVHGLVAYHPERDKNDPLVWLSDEQLRQIFRHVVEDLDEEGLLREDTDIADITEMVEAHTQRKYKKNKSGSKLFNKYTEQGLRSMKEGLKETAH